MTSLGNKEVMAKNLKYYIDKSGKSRRELSEVWGVPYSTLSEWLNAKKYPRIDKIEIMADFFHVLKSDLIEERTPEKVAMQQKNDALSDVVIRMRKDDKFFSAVLAIHRLEPDKLDGLLSFLE